ncbi:hypothetical protein ABPG75_003607 [Micractinium tetrahymenae]
MCSNGEQNNTATHQWQAGPSNAQKPEEGGNGEAGQQRAGREVSKKGRRRSQQVSAGAFAGRGRSGGHGTSERISVGGAEEWGGETRGHGQCCVVRCWSERRWNAVHAMHAGRTGAAVQWQCVALASSVTAGHG